MRDILLVLNDPAYGTERSFNGLRLAGALAKREQTKIRVFLIGDAVSCAMQGQKVPQGFYNTELMLHAVSRRNGEIGVCSSCMDARGLADADLATGCRRSTLEELAEWTLGADRVLIF